MAPLITSLFSFLTVAYERAESLGILFPTPEMTLDGEEFEIPLDRSLQVWVLLPISVATLLMGLLRRNVTTLALREPRTNLVKIKDAKMLQRSSTLRSNGHVISQMQFETRRMFFIRNGGPLYKPKLDRNPMAVLMNPESLANQVMALATSLAPHMLMGTWARYSFAGLAVCRLPFTLTPRFRAMLQSGIELAGQNLDVSYVSSLSWYIVNLFGNSGLLSLMSNGQQDDFLVPNIASQIALNVSPDQVFGNERNSLSKHRHNYSLDDGEDRLLETAKPSDFVVS